MLTLFYRMVGGFIGTGSTFKARLIWSLAAGLYMGFAAVVQEMWVGEVILVALTSAVLAYLGRLIPHARFQGEASIKNTLGMSLIGFVRMAMLVTPIALVKFPLAQAAYTGLFSGVAYFIGWKFLHNVDSGFYFHHKDGRKDIFALGGSEWGEVLTGLLVYQLGFTVLLLL